MLYKAIGESTRFAVSGAVAATLLVRRDAETLTWVAGAILAAVCNKILKRIIKEDRPEAGDDGGMPSSHACSVCHLGVGAALRFSPDESSSAASPRTARRPSRGGDEPHARPQVLVGGAFGAATAVAFPRAVETVEAEVAPRGSRSRGFWYLRGVVVVGSVERAKWLAGAEEAAMMCLGQAGGGRVLSSPSCGYTAFFLSRSFWRGSNLCRRSPSNK